MDQIATAATIDSLPARRPNFYERLNQCQTAFVSCPTDLQSAQTIAALREKFPDLRMKTFKNFNRTGMCWRAQVEECIGQMDMLIIVCDETRVVPRGVGREIKIAKGKQKLLVIFNISTARWERFAGTELIEKDGIKTVLLRQYEPPTHRQAQTDGASHIEKGDGL